MIRGLQSLRCIPRAQACAGVTIVAVLSACAALPRPELLFELESSRDYEGSVRRIAFERSGQAWLATHRALYRVHDGEAQPVEVGTGSTQIRLAPGGSLYARLNYDLSSGALFTVQLVDIAKKPGNIGLRLSDPPYGFGELHLGGAGSLIVTSTPLDDPEGLHGDFLYVFWSRTGQKIVEETLPGPRIGIVDATGDAILLLGRSDAIAFSNAGQRLWELRGSFRKAALAAKGALALLNPDDAIQEVHVFQGNVVSAITMPSPVHDLALGADGSQGAIVVDEGGLFFISPRDCRPAQCTPTKVAVQPVSGSFYITAIQFTDSRTVAFGIIQRSGASPPYDYTAAAAIAMTTSGNILLNVPVKLEPRPTWTPSIDVTAGSPYFAAHTPQRALFIKLNP